MCESPMSEGPVGSDRSCGPKADTAHMHNYLHTDTYVITYICIHVRAYILYAYARLHVQCVRTNIRI